MKLQFDSVAEVLAFVGQLKPSGDSPPRSLHPLLEADSLVEHIARIMNRDKIAAIKVLRAATGLGLKESKERIDRLFL